MLAPTGSMSTRLLLLQLLLLLELLCEAAVVAAGSSAEGLRCEAAVHCSRRPR